MPNVDQPDMPEEDAPKVPENVVNPMDLMPSPRRNTIDFKKPDVASLKTPSGFMKPDNPLKEK